MKSIGNRCLCAWCRWLTRDGHIPANPAADLETPRMPRSLPRTLLSIEQVRQLMGQQPTR